MYALGGFLWISSIKLPTDLSGKATTILLNFVDMTSFLE